MNGQRRIARHQQYAAMYLEPQLETDKQRYFLGSAKVNIDLLSFDAFLPRDRDVPNSERLLSSYELTGCSQLDPHNHIPAIIDEQDFSQALSRASWTQDLAQSKDHRQWPMLSFPAGTRIEGLRGKHRIDAAKVYLRPGVRWWVVDFYSRSEHS